MDDLPTFRDIVQAQDRIGDVIVRTPMLRSDALDEELGLRLLVKAECLQRFGSFKLRGAVNALRVLSDEERARGVLAYSSGNHAIAVAAAARLFGTRAAIVMPADAPLAKREQTLAQGAEITLYDRETQSREAIGRELAEARGLSLIKPFDDARVIAGQGTIGLEIAEVVAADAVLAPASGGGLAGGIAIALPGTPVYAVEPEGHDDFARSLHEHRIVRNEPGMRSICDALLVEEVGALTFAVARRCGVQALSVSDDQVRGAVVDAFTRLRIVLEPSGAAALAAVRKHAALFAGKTIVVIASGGNVDASAFAAMLKA